MRQVFFKAEVNDKLLRIRYDADNDTHAGRSYVEFFEDLSLITIQAITRSETQTFLDQTINFCSWMKNRKTNYLIALFKNYYEAYNPKLLTCPIKKGFYIAAEPRRKLTDAESFMPSLLPIRGNITVLKIVKAKINKTMHHLIRATNIYELS